MFRFKQFTVHQERAAMKVSTDACVLGAYADVAGAEHILDIGTGTGLLALMAAQRNVAAHIDAVELDADAAAQARDNVANSAFSTQIIVHNVAIQHFEEKPYNCILTNPPFYENSLRSPDAAVNRALHADELPFAELVAAVARLLARSGTWWVLLPPPQMVKLTTLAAGIGLQPFQRLALRHNPEKPVFRYVTGFSYETRSADAATYQEEELSIRDADNQTYSAEFTTLLRPFYLKF